uniref:Sulfite exporter TauE/SafE family protein n=1 Tax=candidate division WOR-3 bacterium TaxID=2052148 RepID=A0A7V3V072_UNCW3
MNQALIYRALALGLANGISCLGYCLPITLPALAGAKTAGVGKAFKRVLIFLLGRLIAYLLIGFFAGMLGVSFTHYPVFQKLVIPVLYVLLALILILYGITGINPFARFTFCRLLQPHFESDRFSLLLGLLVGISPCPPFLLAFVNVLEFAGILNGILFFLFFFIATSIYFLPLILFGYLARFELIRLTARLLAIITGIYFLLLKII